MHFKNNLLSLMLLLWMIKTALINIVPQTSTKSLNIQQSNPASVFIFVPLSVLVQSNYIKTLHS